MSDEQEEDTGSELREFPTGDDLYIEDASAVMAAGPSRLLVVAGAPRCGKTTLLNGIYELFQEGPIDLLTFGGSRSLVGFEKRCHPSREVSQADRADTTRTPGSEDARFLHLKFYQTDCAEPPRHLLLSDIDGEFFKRLRDSTDECKRHPFLKRADRLLVLIDGRKLANVRRRHEALEDGKSLLRSMLDSGMIGATTVIHVVITKWDHAHAAVVAGKPMIEFVSEGFAPVLASRSYQWTVNPVAARPAPGSTFAFGHGIAALLPAWVLESTRHRNYQFTFAGNGCREMDRYGRNAATE